MADHLRWQASNIFSKLLSLSFWTLIRNCRLKKNSIDGPVTFFFFVTAKGGWWGTQNCMNTKFPLVLLTSRFVKGMSAIISRSCQMNVWIMFWFQETSSELCWNPLDWISVGLKMITLTEPLGQTPSKRPSFFCFVLWLLCQFKRCVTGQCVENSLKALTYYHKNYIIGIKQKWFCQIKEVSSNLLLSFPFYESSLSLFPHIPSPTQFWLNGEMHGWDARVEEPTQHLCQWDSSSDKRHLEVTSFPLTCCTAASPLTDM